MDLALLVIRVVVGGLLFAHGTQKLFGWFGGHGLDGSGGWLESLGFKPGRPMAMLAGGVEAVGGSLLLLGLLTPLAAAMIVGQMTVAALAVHRDKGLWNTNGGYELNVVYATAALAIAFIGPGAFSLDEVLDLANSGMGYGIGALLVGGGAAILVEAFRRAQVQDAGEETEGTPSERQGERRAA
ncbi:MAG TPA: DoxX family protein [Actinomycetota bacterium]|nr:DoxX family protein [Actinomycetota bacterium]